MQSADSCVLIVAPIGRDALNACEVLVADGINASICTDIPEMCARAQNGVGALLVAQEALADQSMACVSELLRQQPPWSDLALVLLTSGGDATRAGAELLRELGDRCAITILERPLRRVTLVSALRSALRGRKRQCQVRDLLEQRESMLQELQKRAESLEKSQEELLHAKDIISKHASQLEITVRERTAKLKETNAQLEAFSYSISHDMRGPLRAMQQYSTLLLEEEQDKLSPDGKDFLTRISRAAGRLDRLIQDVLLYSRAAQEEIQLAEVDLGKLVHEIIHQYPGFQPPKVSINIDEPLEAVVAHEASLTQCISNLLSNAVKFVPPGKQPEVRVHTQRTNGTVRIWIEDNGIGIAPKNHHRIFNIFERVHSPEQYDGTGIGLSIVKKTVERMGGDVGLESALGKGTRFWIDLPASKHS